MPETIGIPTRPEEITAVWLTKALRSTGALGETAVASLTVEPVEVGSNVGQVARVRLIYDADIDNAPATLIAKFSHPDPAVREGLAALYEREVRVYQELTEQITLPMPRCYFSVFHTDTSHSVLLLEDLARWRRVDLDKGCSVADAETIVTQFAQHHARWWQNPQLETIGFLEHISTTFTDEDLEFYQSAWAQFEERVTTLLPDSYLPQSFLDIGTRFSKQRAEIRSQIVKSPFTFIHNDAYINNMMFAVDENDPPLIVLDWQTCGIGLGIHDIAFLMFFSVTVKQRRKTEKRLLQAYRTTLVEHGVTNYSFDQCWQDYRLSFFEMLARIVIITAIFEIDTPFMRGALEISIPRLASFAEDHRVDEFLS